MGAPLAPPRLGDPAFDLLFDILNSRNPIAKGSRHHFALATGFKTDRADEIINAHNAKED